MARNTPDFRPFGKDSISELLIRLKSARTDIQRLREHVASFERQVNEFEREYRALTDLRRTVAVKETQGRIVNIDGKPSIVSHSEPEGQVPPELQTGQDDGKPVFFRRSAAR